MFDALLVIIRYPLVALGGIGDLLVTESMDSGSLEEVTDLNREQGRGGCGAVLRGCQSLGGCYSPNLFLTLASSCRLHLPLEPAGFMQIYLKHMQISRGSVAALH